jgi:hypothetical protein
MHGSLTIQPEWTFAEKLFFRFIFLFFALFIIFCNNGAYPFWYYISQLWEGVMHTFIPWVGKNILHLKEEITVFTNGSGDTTYDYVTVFTILMVSLAGTLIWSVFDRRSRNYSTLYYWLTVAIRYYVGLMLFNYGIYKVFKLQFPSPGLYRLTQPYGESSPMGLAWTFLGFSKGYNMFMGVAEIAALLLLFRRTMTFGAIITLGTAANVMAVNYFYDVPVKILSTALVVMTLLLLSKDIRTLFIFFFKGISTKLEVIKAPVFKKRAFQIAKVSFKYLLIAYVVIMGFVEGYQSTKQYGDAVPKHKFFGIYNVDSTTYTPDTVNNKDLQPGNWKEWLIDNEYIVRLRLKNDSVLRYSLTMDTVNSKLTFVHNKDSTKNMNFSYISAAGKKLVLSGKAGEDSISVILNRRVENTSAFLLTNRGFHWVNEYPFNR